jgi:hypothetical protein
MSTHLLSFRSPIFFVVAIAAVPVAAQTGEPGQVQGTGTAVLEQLPGRLRVHVELTGRGKSPTEALAALRDRRDAVKALLPTLGADAESIRFDDPQISRGEEQQKMNEMLMQRMGRTKRGASPDGPPTLPTTARAHLTADWTLKAADVEQLLAETFALQEKIKVADVAGVKEAPKLSPEEEEMQAEMRQMMGGNQGTSPGEPQFSFVLKVAADERAKLTAEAFQKAKADAERLAAAAGAKLGKLTALQGTTQGADMGDGGYGGDYYNQMMARRMGISPVVAAGAPAEDETVGPTTGKVKLTVVVQAYFALE